MGILNFFSERRRQEEPDRSITIDFHSHILPGIDDGAKTVEDSVRIIRELQHQGVQKIITTPHILRDLYPNTPETIRAAEQILRTALKAESIEIDLQVAAEYYMDEYFINLLKTGAEILTFNDKSILVETNYVERPDFLEQVIFDLKIDGYDVILAHPERYHYLIGNFGEIDKLADTGLKYQVNLISFTGYYSPEVKKTAEYLLKNQMISYLGSDIHHIEHAKIITNFKRGKTYQKLLELPILNNAMH
jgi:protein-tyrosine phosphatase